MEIYSQFRVIVAVAAVLLSFSKLESSSPTGQKRSEVAADHREPGNTVWETELFFQTSWTEGNRNSMELSHYMRVLTTFIYTKRHMYVTDNCCSCVASHKTFPTQTKVSLQEREFSIKENYVSIT